MDEEQAVFEHLILSNFKKWSSTTLKTFNNYTIIMTDNSDKIRILVWYFRLSCLFLSLFSRLVNFMFLNILKEKLHISYLEGTFSMKAVQSFQNSTVQTATISKAIFKLYSIFYIKNLWYTFNRDNSLLQTPLSLSQ